MIIIKKFDSKFFPWQVVWCKGEIRYQNVFETLEMARDFASTLGRWKELN